MNNLLTTHLSILIEEVINTSVAGSKRDAVGSALGHHHGGNNSDDESESKLETATEVVSTVNQHIDKFQ